MNKSVSAIYKPIDRDFNEDINSNHLDEWEESKITNRADLLFSTIETQVVTLTKDNRIDNVQLKITSTGKEFLQYLKLANHFICSDYETKDRSPLQESNKTENNFTLSAKENIEVGQTKKINKIFNGDINVDPHNVLRIEDSPTNRKIASKLSTVSVSV